MNIPILPRSTETTVVPVDSLRQAEAEIRRLRTACELTLMFHGAGPWDDDKKIEWANKLTMLLGPAVERTGKWGEATPSNEATTRNLCNAIRAALNRKA